MKLTDKQIFAVISQIEAKFNEDNDAKRKELYKDPNLIKRSQELFKEFKAISTEIRETTM